MVGKNAAAFDIRSDNAFRYRDLAGDTQFEIGTDGTLDLQGNDIGDVGAIHASTGTVTSTPTDSNDIANKEYVDNTANGNGGGGSKWSEADVIFAHDYSTAQDAVDAAGDGDLVIFFRGQGPNNGEWGEFTLPPTDNLTLWSPNRAVIRSELPEGSTDSNNIIDQPRSHPDWNEDVYTNRTDLSSSVSRYDGTIDVDDASGYEPGDVIVLHDRDQQWVNHSREGGTTAEMLVISDVDESANSLIIKDGQSGVTFDYSASGGEVWKVNFPAENLVIDGFEVVGAMRIEDVGDTGPWSEDGIVVSRTRNTTIRNCYIRKVPDSATQAHEPFNHHYHNLRIEHSGHYGTNCIGLGDHVLVSNCIVENVGRYAHKFGSSGPDSGSGGQPWTPLKNCSVVGSSIKQSGQGLNTHPNAYDINFRDCTVSNSNRAIRVRAQNVTVDGLTLESTRTIGFVRYDFSGLTIRNVVADGLDGVGLRIWPAGTGEGHDPLIENVTFDNWNMGTIGSSSLFSISSATDGGVYHLKDFTWSNIHVDCNGEDFIRVNDEDCEALHGHFIIKDCVVKDSWRVWYEDDTQTVDADVIVKNNIFIDDAEFRHRSTDGDRMHLTHNTLVNTGFDFEFSSPETNEYNVENL